MNKKLCLLAVSMLSLSLMTYGVIAQTENVAPKNLLQNPGFEDGMNGWLNPFPKEITGNETAAHGGQKSIEIDTQVENKAAYLTQIVRDIVGGAEYDFSVWARVPSGSQPAHPAIKIETYSPKGGNTAGWSQYITLPADGSWHKLEIRKQLLGDTTFCKLLLRAFPRESVIFDDASFVMTSAAPELTVMTPAKAVVGVGKKDQLTYELSLRQPWKSSKLPQINASIAPQYANSGLGKTYNISATVSKIDDLHYKATVAIPELASTNYTVNFQSQFDDRIIKTPYPAYLFTVPDNRQPKFLTDNGTILWQGKPFFPIGMYHPTLEGVGGQEKAYKLLAESGFNAVQGGGPVGSDGTLSLIGFKKSLDLAKKYGLAVDVPLYSAGKVKDNLAKNVQAVKAFAEDPTVLSWKIFDEPHWRDLDGGTAAEVPGAYRALKVADPNHPIELTLTDDYDFWGNFCDILQPDIYPFPRFPLTLVSDRAQMTMKAAHPWQNVSVVLECGFSADLSNQPSVAQARSMVYLALISGAKGIWWYSMHDPGWNLIKTPLWPHMKEINDEIKVLSDPLMLGKVVEGVSCNQTKVHFRAVEYQNKTYLLVTNPEDKPTQAVFTLPKNLRLWHPLNSDDSTALKDQKITLSLQGIDSRTLILEK